MRFFSKVCSGVFIMMLIGAAALSTVADAEDFSVVRPGGRGGTWEFMLPLIYSDSANISGSNGSGVSVDGDWGFGFGFGYNFSDNFQLNGMMNWSYRSYQATIVQDNGVARKYNNYMDTSTISVNGVYYFLNGNITPFVTGGVGITYVDTNIPTGPSSTACWWDPWWGYVCGGYAPTKTENDISYSAGLGVRFDISRTFGMQASYNRAWVDFSKASSIPEFDIWRLDFLFRM
jgi:opacity protein-like surface antigen